MFFLYYLLKILLKKTAYSQKNLIRNFSLSLYKHPQEKSTSVLKSVIFFKKKRKEEKKKEI